MRYVSIAIVILMIYGCSNLKDKNSSSNILEKEQNKNNKKNDNEDVILYAEYRDTFNFSTGELKQIFNLFPALDTEWITEPNISYQKSISFDSGKIFKEFTNSDGKKDRISFNSELGQDEYFILYAYFLKKKNGEKKYQTERQNLLMLYREINDIFSGLRNGGTYFGHQYRRSVGYAEYSVYLYSLTDSLDDYYNKKYDIRKQKQLYINSLKQIINDEESVDYWTLDKKGKLERKKKFLRLITDIEKLISNYFYLKMAQEFQYSHY